MGLFDKLFGANKKVAPQREVDSGFFEDWSYKRSREDLLAELKSMIDRNFADYEVICEYEASNLNSDCHPACTPIQFMFQKNGRNQLAVVVVRQNTYRGMNVLGTQKLCEMWNIPYIRFFEEYPNKEEYVVPRIQSYLK